MFTIRFLMLALFCYSSVKCEQCDFTDENCLTASCKLSFKPFVMGQLGSEPSDPLRVDDIEAHLTTIKYKLTDSTMSGMKDCHVDLVRINISRKTFDYHIGCPHLVIEGDCEINGNLSLTRVEGKGTCKVDLYDYRLLFNGDYKTYVDQNGKSHLKIKNHILNLEVKGRVHYKLINFFNGDENLSRAVHRFVNENWRIVDKIVRKPVMEAFMRKYIKNVNTYLSVAPLDDVFHKAN